jgi:hypothetical protein
MPEPDSTAIPAPEAPRAIAGPDAASGAATQARGAHAAAPSAGSAGAAAATSDEDEVVDAELVESDDIADAQVDVSSNPENLYDDDTQIIPVIRA